VSIASGEEKFLWRFALGAGCVWGPKLKFVRMTRFHQDDLLDWLFGTYGFCLLFFCHNPSSDCGVWILAHLLFLGLEVHLLWGSPSFLQWKMMKGELD
jgi:hypothetical protein